VQQQNEVITKQNRNILYITKTLIVFQIKAFVLKNGVIGIL